MTTCLFLVYLFFVCLSICLTVWLLDCIVKRQPTYSLWHSAYPHQPYVDTLYVLLLHRCRPKLVLTRTSIPLSDCLSACFWGDLRVSGKRLPKPSQQTKRMSWNLQNRGQQVNNISKVALGKRKNICEWRSVQDRVTLWWFVKRKGDILWSWPTEMLLFVVRIQNNLGRQNAIIHCTKAVEWNAYSILNPFQCFPSLVCIWNLFLSLPLCLLCSPPKMHSFISSCNSISCLCVTVKVWLKNRYINLMTSHKVTVALMVSHMIKIIWVYCS